MTSSSQARAMFFIFSAETIISISLKKVPFLITLRHDRGVKNIVSCRKLEDEWINSYGG